MYLYDNINDYIIDILPFTLDFIIKIQKLNYLYNFIYINLPICRITIKEYSLFVASTFPICLQNLPYLSTEPSLFVAFYLHIYL